MQLVHKELAGQGLRSFGAVMSKSREMQVLVPESMKEGATLEELDNYWVKQLRSALASADYGAACYVTDVRVASPEGQLISPGVLLFIEEAGANAEYHFYVYEKRQDSTIAMRKPNVEPTPNRLFV